MDAETELAQEISILRTSDASLTIKQVHELLNTQGRDLTASQVKKAFGKATKLLAAKEEQASKQQEASRPKDPNALWSQAVTFQQQGRTSEALEYGALAFLNYPDFPSVALEKEVAASHRVAHHTAIFQSIAKITTAYDEDKVNTEDTHRAFVIAAGLCLQSKDAQNALTMAQAAQSSLETYFGLNNSSMSAEYYSTRSAALYSLTGSLLVELSFYKDSVTALDKSLELNPNSIQTRQMRCVARFKATKFAGIVEDAALLKADAAKNGATKYLVGPFLVAAMASYMTAKVQEGNEWLALGQKYAKQFTYLGPDPRIYDMALETQKIFNKNQ
ncbi:hypothetical protein HDU79_007192 [Rhizoclosmatium sp. JEL0117]|nr:hypothetical protein HDU79_007192 [Rhizoclosmatium sp. JEL0117]